MMRLFLQERAANPLLETPPWRKSFWRTNPAASLYHSMKRLNARHILVQTP